MPILGMSFHSMEGSRKNIKLPPELKINSTPKILKMREVDVPTLNKKALSIDFEFISSYEPGLGSIKLSGNIIYLTEEAKRIMKEWKEHEKIPEEDSIEVLNHLFRRCLIKIAVIADDLQLPPPIQLPTVSKKTDQSSYIG